MYCTVFEKSNGCDPQGPVHWDQPAKVHPLGRLWAEGSLNIWQSRGSGSLPLPRRLGGARPHEHAHFGHKGACTHGALESGMKPVSPRAPACQPTPTDSPANVPAAGRVPRPVEVVASDRVRRQGEKGPKRRFWSPSAEHAGFRAPRMRHRTAHWVR